MVTRLPRVVVAGTHSGVGKTTVAVGLMAALRARGRRVAAAKVGPDFIDPSYHALATGRAGRNLDVWMCGEERIAPLFLHGAAGADVGVIEGVMGLFDGRTGSGGEASTAHVARLLTAPVILVVDAGGMADSVAALVRGFLDHDPALRLAGVVLNRVGSERHADILRAALVPLGVPVVGVLRRDDAFVVPSRHLGLVPVAERQVAAQRMIAVLAARVAESCDLDAIEALAATAPPIAAAPWAPPRQAAPPAPVRVSIAEGAAFSFVYAEHRELLAAAGADVCAFDPLTAAALPEGTDALYLPGGFPEEHAEALSDNAPLRRAVLAHVALGRPVLAECGGLLYLCESLDGWPQCGVLRATASMGERVVLGYREAVADAGAGPWQAGQQVRAHEFHASAVTPEAGRQAAWRLTGGRREGFVRARTHASYLHPHWAATPALARRLVALGASTRREAAA
jgi:cobyrinic acid a,c-diamide synthase